ncbi:glucoamylase family protein [Arvimicrobium flavum]|uniref:glucoamylase family protein n=1 Tax=Arvimicrobium flavum TaxID=3393320 RepID=UPI00237BB815|nr:glucoamylase family protein [Mesorhizobium shangrilense]
MDARATEHETIDAGLIDRLQRAAFGYFRLFTNEANGLVADTSLPDWPCSIAAVGFALSCYPVAVTRGWIDRAEAGCIVAATLRFLDDAQTDAAGETSHRGFFYHFLDMATGLRVWNSELSFMDTAILMAGVLSASAFLDGPDAVEAEIRERAARIFGRVDWRWTETRGHAVHMGWKPRRGFLPDRWTGFSESLLMFVLGLGSETSPLSPASYETWLDTCDWYEGPAGGYVYAGPLFIHLFPHAWIDFRGIADRLTRRHATDYCENTRTAIRTHRVYAADNPHRFSGYCDDLWGLTACNGAKARLTLRNGRRVSIAGYAARGAPFGPDDGTLAPWATLSCLPFAPAEAARALRHLLAAYPAVLSDDRFPDSFNPSIRGDGPEGWVARRCTGIDQGLLVMSIENFRSGLCWRLMRASPIVKRGLAAAGFRGGWLEAQAD